MSIFNVVVWRSPIASNIVSFSPQPITFVYVLIVVEVRQPQVVFEVGHCQLHFLLSNFPHFFSNSEKELRLGVLRALRLPQKLEKNSKVSRGFVVTLWRAAARLKPLRRRAPRPGFP